MSSSLSTLLTATLLLSAGAVHAADPVASLRSPKPRGIWAAIAISPKDGQHGIFWGADERSEAEALAIEHCVNAGGEECQIAETFRNHRHRSDDDGSGFPYHPCGALATDGVGAASMTHFGSDTAPTRRDAERGALEICQSNGAQCKIREWVCT